MKDIAALSAGAKYALWSWTLALSIALSFFPICVGPATAQAQPVVRVEDDRLSVEAQGTQLGLLLQKVGDLVTFETLILSPDAQRKTVTVTFRDIPIKEGLLKIMEAADINHVVWGGQDVPFRIFAGSAEDPVPSQTSPAGNEDLYPDEEDEFSSPSTAPSSTGGAPSTRRRPAPGAIVPPPTQPRSQSPSTRERSIPESYPEEFPPDDPGEIPLDEFPPDELPPEDTYEPDWPSDPYSTSTPQQPQRRGRATDEASLTQRPRVMVVAKVWSLLIFGFAIGIPLVGGQSLLEVSRRFKKGKAETTRV